MAKVMPFVVSHGLFCAAGAALARGYILGGIVAGAFALLVLFAASRMN